ncbi:HalOD1 output domain-containing protein [Halorubrum sp. CSM-61]|uniref:HalOD1 output domain-containing protein n=1 Tax=Halorubrum sp. CSM-61 TaxID=2485838 RepID=UPI000F4CF6F4|nr:HalOD1 output domain-containing protein [Halorubrum sp. CSM-61]
MSNDFSVRNRYDWDDVPPLVGVVETLSDAADVEPDAIPTLADTIDPESLNGLCTNTPDSNVVTISFVHAGYDVTVRSDGFVSVDGTGASVGP